MSRSLHHPVATIVAAILCAAQAPAAAGDDPARSTMFPAAYFASMQPYSAFDMLAATPGFTFAESDPDVRGFAGAAGNVLIDGARPATKQESLEATLRRIPAAAVDRIELIRAGAAGVDMQGHAVLANVVRMRRARTAGALELASTVYEGFVAPRTGGEWTSETEARRLELSAAAYTQAGDEHGLGAQERRAEDGALLAHADYEQDERERPVEIAAALEQRWAGGLLRANGAYTRERTRLAALETQRFPEPDLESDLERERQRDAELGLHYEQALAQTLQMEWAALYRRSNEDESEANAAGADQSLFAQITEASEAIMQGRVRGAFDRGTVEGGLEGARNVLDGQSALQENGIAVALPSANVRVEERRLEAFGLVSVRASEKWALEAGARFEYSELEQAGDVSVRKRFFFPKPRMLVSYAAPAGGRWRMLLERRVGQLDFEDFVTSTSLSAETVSAGNPELEPERSWIAELAWERQWRPDASVLIAVRREWISELIDRTPVAVDGELLDGVGNIGEGRRAELEVSLSLPLSAVGLHAARVKATGLWRRGEATDPATGRTRAISEDLPFEGAAHFTHDLSAWRVHWGVDVAFATEVRQFMLDEVRTERLQSRIDVYVEYTPTPAWNLRLAALNLNDREYERERSIHDGPRGHAPLDYVETRALRMGTYYSLSIRRSFGG